MTITITLEELEQLATLRSAELFFTHIAEHTLAKSYHDQYYALMEIILKKYPDYSGVLEWYTTYVNPLKTYVNPIKTTNGATITTFKYVNPIDTMFKIEEVNKCEANPEQLSDEVRKGLCPLIPYQDEWPEREV